MSKKSSAKATRSRKSESIGGSEPNHIFLSTEIKLDYYYCSDLIQAEGRGRFLLQCVPERFQHHLYPGDGGLQSSGAGEWALGATAL